MSEGDPAGVRTMFAPAKINLFLRVLRRRPDGYHDLETAIVPLSLTDRLEVHALSDPERFGALALSLDVRGRSDIVPAVPAGEQNLVLRAASALADRARVTGFAHFTLYKEVPARAGMGGGSADAAASLLALNELWGCGLDGIALGEVGAGVGSDVPALLTVARGGGVVARGRGEQVEPIPVRSFRWALVTFPFGVSTADAFRWWDEGEERTPGQPERVLDAARRGDAVALGRALFNDLQEPVMRRHPEVREARDRLIAAGATGAVMCGSGPSVAGVLPDGVSVDLPDTVLVESLSGRAGPPGLEPGSPGPKPGVTAIGLGATVGSGPRVATNGAGDTTPPLG
jgi:4-diphosphocytidyl-2-C-methyl-D-erythritol kinase